MRTAPLTFSKFILVFVLLNIVIFKLVNYISYFEITDRSSPLSYENADIFTIQKSFMLKNDFLENDRVDMLMKQKIFISNLSIFTLKDTDTQIFINQEDYNNDRFNSSNNSNTFIKYIFDNPGLGPANIQIHKAPVKIELIKKLSSEKSKTPSFEVLLNNSTPFILTDKNLLQLSSKYKKIQYTWMESVTYPATFSICPQSVQDNNKQKSLARIENVIKQAPFMKDVINIERFRSKSNRPNVLLCFWLTFSSYEELIKSDIYLRAFAPEYSWMQIK